jgi:RNA polymerase subunit RPABC4/transcription elongation factor Spt4
MAKVSIKCRNCDNEWPKEIQKLHHGICPVCGKSYCAKWRKWVYIADNERTDNHERNSNQDNSGRDGN